MIPETKQSLILRLCDKQDSSAWGQFVEIYGPFILRLAKSRGFQDADARELLQEVLLSVSRAIHRWEPDSSRGRFRDWLFRITQNLMLQFLTRRKHQSLAVTQAAIDELSEVSDGRDELAEIIELEYQREVFRWAARRVQSQVSPATWRAFWMTSVDQVSVDQVSQSLGLTVGAIYIARSRVQARLRKVVESVDPDRPVCSGSDEQ